MRYMIRLTDHDGITFDVRLESEKDLAPSSMIRVVRMMTEAMDARLETWWREDRC